MRAVFTLDRGGVVCVKECCERGKFADAIVERGEVVGSAAANARTGTRQQKVTGRRGSDGRGGSLRLAPRRKGGRK